MRSKARVIAALGVALMCAPGTWLRSEWSRAMPDEIRVTQIAAPQATAAPEWELAGIWQYEADNLYFGGFSALLALRGNRLRAFSDRGFRMSLDEPDQAAPKQQLNRQFVAHGWEWALWDIEAATRDPATGTYWLAYEQTHAIHRFSVASTPEAVRDLTPEVDWGDNAGIEAMVRLDDGRFVVLPEGEREGLIFADDPVSGGAPVRFAFRTPAPGFAATDLAQLPDGRLLVLMRKLASPLRVGWPPFQGLLAIGDVPQQGGRFAPRIALRFDGLLPADNYEGLAVRGRADGRIDVWIIADDNFSVFQRNLLVKLIHTP